MDGRTFLAIAESVKEIIAGTSPLLPPSADFAADPFREIRIEELRQSFNTIVRQWNAAKLNLLMNNRKSEAEIIQRAVDLVSNELSWARSLIKDQPPHIIVQTALSTMREFEKLLLQLAYEVDGTLPKNVDVTKIIHDKVTPTQIANAKEGGIENAGCVWDLCPLERDMVKVPLLDKNICKPGDTNLTFRGRRLYVPRDEDISLIKSLYGDFSLPSPPWHRMQADLVDSGHAPEVLEKCSAMVLLVYLKKLHTKPQPNRRKANSSKGDVPLLDTTNGLWVSNKLAAKLDGVKTRTLADYRQDGSTNKDSTQGTDKDGRIWRRSGTRSSHPWYLKSSLKSQQPQNRYKP